MSDEDLGRLLKRIIRWAMASAIIGAVAVLLVIVMNWENSPLRGWHLVKDDTPAETPETIPQPRPTRRHVARPSRPPVKPVADPEVNQQPENQQAPVMATNANLPSWPRYQAAPVTQYVVLVVPEKHGWPRRFFGAIGHGVRKVVTFGH